MRVPLRKTGERWGIDILPLQDRSLSQATDKARRINDAGNLKQFGLGAPLSTSFTVTAT